MELDAIEDREVAEGLKATKKYRGWKAMPFIIGNETFEKLGSIGATANLVVYLTTVFNMRLISAATLINVLNGTTNFAPLVGAFLSDTYFGRYKTLGFTTIASFLGLLLVMLTAAVSKLHPPHCGTSGPCVRPNQLQMGVLLAGFAFLVVGAGGVRSCNLAFGADQFNPETEAGKKGINSFFNWYFSTYTFATMVALTLIVWVQDENCTAGKLEFLMADTMSLGAYCIIRMGGILSSHCRTSVAAANGLLKLLVGSWSCNASLHLQGDPQKEFLLILSAGGRDEHVMRIRSNIISMMAGSNARTNKNLHSQQLSSKNKATMLDLFLRHTVLIWQLSEHVVILKVVHRMEVRQCMA